MGRREYVIRICRSIWANFLIFSTHYFRELNQPPLHRKKIDSSEELGHVWYVCLNNSFNFFENMCRWKSVWKYMQCCLKIENMCLNTCTKQALNFLLQRQNWKHPRPLNFLLRALFSHYMALFHWQLTLHQHIIEFWVNLL